MGTIRKLDKNRPRCEQITSKMFDMFDIALQAIGSNSITSPISQLQEYYVQRVSRVEMI